MSFEHSTKTGKKESRIYGGGTIIKTELPIQESSGKNLSNGDKRKSKGTL